MTKMSSQSQPTVLQIGQMFVKQYYLQLNSDPKNVHRFYWEDSLFAHGGHELGSTETIKGQKAIHDKIMLLDFSEVHARIKQVDSQATLDTGILVQVTGEISTHRNPMRNFVQTFVLRRKESKQYYVYNDIFRYQEPVEYDYTSESENNENQSDRGDVGVPQETTPTYSAPQPLVQPTPEPEHPDLQEEQADLGKPEVSPPEAVVAASDRPWVSYNGRPEHGLDGQVGSEPAEPYEAYTSPLEASTDLLSPQAKDSSPGPTSTTWAGLVSRPGPAPAPLLQPPTPKRQQQPLLQREAKPPKKALEQTPRSPPSAPSAAVGKERLPKKGPPPSSFQVPDSQQIFIGGLPPEVGDEDVKTAFADMGTITEIRLNQKNFGFVVFDSPEAVQRILERKVARPFFIRNKNINIEPKKASGTQRPGGFTGRRAADSGGSRGGGGSMTSRKSFKN